MMLILLIMGHAVADFALQSPTMAEKKNRNRPPDLSRVPPGQSYVPCWPYWLSAHALIHGFMVWFITGSVSLGVAESVAHWAIDFGKCESWYGVHADQALHVACKVVWSVV